MTAEQVLAYINADRRTSYRLVGRYLQGESGAARKVVDDEGNRFVLKFGSSINHEVGNAHPGRITERLRSVGYPTPHYLAVGVVRDTWYIVQTVMRGAPIGNRVSLVLLPQILHLNDLQRGQGDSRDENPERITRGVMEGFAGYCVIDTLRTYSDRSAAMLTRLQCIVAANAGECPRRNDVVHWDFHTNNVLMENDGITGVIDWEGSYTGDRAFDLATMLFYTWNFADFRDALLQAILERTTRQAVAVYLAHMIVRQLDWSMRHHPREAVDHYMNDATAMLEEIEK
jgi:fructosamine-3-kinase